VCTSINNAKTGGISYRDTYLFPDPTSSKTAGTQMKELVQYLQTNCPNAWSGRIWLDIEGSQYWLGSYSSNKVWYQNLVDSCSTYGVKCGVYSSQSQWQSIFGSTTYSYGSNLPMWYAHYDGVASFSDYPNYKFGGWSSPYAKQYEGDVTLCSFSVDRNYAPTWSS
jgi:GH25 family lysozyme M1 (1,4-beta-N-acetylmuramidase)